jgi:hypothetical protein
MLLAGGILLLVLGVLCGAVLVLAPLGLIDATAGVTLWILFPAFTIVGYLLAAAPVDNEKLPLLARATGIALFALALAAGVALVMQGAALLEPRTGTFSLWYVLVIGLLLGAAGLASHRSLGKT